MDTNIESRDDLYDQATHAQMGNATERNARKNSNALTRVDLANAVYNCCDMTRDDATRLTGAILTTMTETIIRGEQVKIANFGIFKTHQKRSRVGRNPNTLEKAIIPARKVVLFKASARLKDAVNSRQP
ncbi:MAG: integration host factor subunit alpha [Hyphomicrobiales bacterium]|nr:integration host factor subunit alpha [Hyphomicrobiales bacterium]